MKIIVITLLVLQALTEGVRIPNSATKYFSNLFGIDSDAAASPLDIREIFPRLVPHPDNRYLLEFHTDSCDHAKQMEPLLRRLESDLSTTVWRINIQRLPEGQALLDAVGHHEGGSFPFYYNRRTAQAINGATTYSNLKQWGLGECGHAFNLAPVNYQAGEGISNTLEGGERAYTGVFGIAYEKWQKKEAEMKQAYLASISSQSPSVVERIKQLFRRKSKVAPSGVSPDQSAAERLAARRQQRAHRKNS